MPRYQDFQEIPAWQTAHQAVLEIYKITEKFPQREMYGLISQIRRSAASIAANIAEGFNRNTTKELIRFLFNARGSCGETFYHIILAYDLGYINKFEFNNLSEKYKDLGKQLSNWIRALNKRIH